MSGHSKWATIKRKKAAVDAQKGKVFSKLAREITVAARQGGGNPDANFRLKAAIDKAREFNLPAENIDRAVQRGTGGGADDHVEEIVYEGYGPAGVAILLDCITDNRNRTAGDIRHTFAKKGGNLGESGCVAWLFQSKAAVHVTAPSGLEEAVYELAVDAGAEDMEPEEDGFTVYGLPESLEDLEEAFQKSPYKVTDAGVERVPKTRVKVEGQDAERLLQLIETLEEHDDVQSVWSNFELSDDEWKRLLEG